MRLHKEIESEFQEKLVAIRKTTLNQCHIRIRDEQARVCFVEKLITFIRPGHLSPRIGEGGRQRRHHYFITRIKKATI